jgi:hypothetical protein
MAKKERNQFLVAMQAPKNSGTTFSHGGKTFDISADGTVEVPSEMAEVLKSHGFVQIVEPQVEE